MFKVCSSKCDECLFSKDKIVDDARRKEIIETCIANNSFFVCHKFGIEGDEGTIGEEVCCRGFYESYGHHINLIRIAQRLRAVEEVDVEIKRIEVE